MSRTLIVSQRSLRHDLARSCSWELEDTIRKVEDADLLELRRLPRLPLKGLNRRLKNRTGLQVDYEPPVRREAVKQDYEVLFYLGQNIWEVESLGQVSGWESRCRFKVAWFEEVWNEDLKGNMKKVLSFFDRFDCIIVGCSQAVETLSRMTKARCVYLPPGVDAIRFCPYPSPPDRSIHAYSMGRRNEKVHRELVRLGREKGFFYLHDTVTGSRLKDHLEHRKMTADLIKRTGYFLVNRPKVNLQNELRQDELGFRFFEGAAAGAVMLGERPDCPVFRENFDWDDAVIELPPDTGAIEGFLEDLDAQKGRTERIRRENVRHSLLRHDWVYRWEAILELAGLPPRPGLHSRKEALSALAFRLSPASGSE